MRRHLVGLLAVLSLLALAAVAIAGPVAGPRMVAEWEPALGTLIRWPLGIPLALVRELAEDDLLYTLVEGQAAENSARSTFAAAGVDLAQVVFIQADVYSMWTRDWGPQGVFDASGRLGVADPWFNGYPWVPGCNDGAAPPERASHRTGRGYEDDDILPATVAQALGLPHHPLAAYCTGGNIMTDGQGIAWSTAQMLAENAPHMDPATFVARVAAAMGLDDYRFTLAPEIYGIQHIDCYAKLLDEETVLVKEVPASHPEHACCEELAATFAAAATCYGRPYHVRRIWCPRYDGDAVAAYTNSLILNRKVLVPTFGIAADADALATYADAMPGYEVIGFPGSWYDYDALHCRTMGLFDPAMLRVLHARLPEYLPAGNDHQIGAWIDDRSEAGLVPGAQRVCWRVTGAATWQMVVMVEAGTDSFVAAIPAQTPGTVVEYYLTASDHAGHTETVPRTAPAGYYRFTVEASTAVDPVDGTVGPTLVVHPNPASVNVHLAFTLARAAPVVVRVHDARGRLVRTLLTGSQPRGVAKVVWDGRDDGGRAVASGVYLARVTTAGATLTARVVIMR